jgi:hypothetical protein
MSASIRVRDLPPSFVLEQPDPADIPLTILRLSFRAVKGNINRGAIRILGEVQGFVGRGPRLWLDEVQDFGWTRSKTLTLCNMGRRSLDP